MKTTNLWIESFNHSFGSIKHGVMRSACFETTPLRESNDVSPRKHIGEVRHDAVIVRGTTPQLLETIG